MQDALEKLIDLGSIIRNCLNILIFFYFICRELQMKLSIAPMVSNYGNSVKKSTNHFGLKEGTIVI
jgi:hypothetical protein